MEFKKDFSVLEFPKAVLFRDKYNVQMLMRIEEIHKFRDGTLQQAEEALDLRIKEYLIRHARARELTVFWTKKDFQRNKEFI